MTWPLPPERNLIAVPCGTCRHLGGVHHVRQGHVDLAAGACTVAGCDCKRFVDGSPAPVALADHGDHCARCHRPLNVNEPVFRDAGGGIRCGACNDAVPEPRRPVAAEYAAPGVPDVDPKAARTSAVMRSCANLLIAASLPGSLREFARSFANELHARAFELEKARDDRDWRAGERVSAADLLRAIGEVRS